RPCARDSRTHDGTVIGTGRDRSRPRACGGRVLFDGSGRTGIAATGLCRGGRVAVTYFDWAGWTAQRVVVPWTVIEGAEDAMAFAERLAGASIRRASRTLRY